MRIIYFDGPAGVAGDMFVGALLDAGAPWDAVRGAVSALGLEGVGVTARKVRRGGLSATKFDVTDLPTGQPVEEVGKRPFVAPSLLLETVAKASLQAQVKEHAEAVLRLLAEAEAKVHGVPAEEVHFHEMGAADTLADVVAACAAFVALAPDRAVAGPLALGRGMVRSEHGYLPIPAPATLEMLRGAPVRAGEPEAELTTPTGAALIAHFCSSFGPLPPMTVQAVGYGAGSREFSVPNVFRAVVGEAGEGEL